MRGLASVSLEPFGRVYGIVVAIELAIRFLRARAQVGLRQHALAPAAELARVLVRTEVELPVSGCTSWQNGRWRIVLNGAEPLVRQRSSVAHEFKHAVDHRFRHELYFDRPGLSATTQAEYAADYFAACLLRPKRWL
jgi:Zn-dependent peptidase ImmA (M78 family)